MRYTIADPESIYELGRRKNQEDCIYPELRHATTNDTLFIVCDGMGGHEQGEVASSTVCSSLSNYLNSHAQDEFNVALFEEALNAAYDALDQHDNGAEKKMGTTMTLLKLHKGGCLMAHIGDSRIYHVRPSKRQILYKSRDHSLINDLYDIGEITLSEMKNSSQKNIITRVMQPLQKYRSKADIKESSDIKAGDYFLLFTDGMLEEIEDDNVVNILCLNSTCAEKADIFREITKENRDNRSAYIIYIESVE